MATALPFAVPGPGRWLWAGIIPSLGYLGAAPVGKIIKIETSHGSTYFYRKTDPNDWYFYKNTESLGGITDKSAGLHMETVRKGVEGSATCYTYVDMSTKPPASIGEWVEVGGLPSDQAALDTPMGGKWRLTCAKGNTWVYEKAELHYWDYFYCGVISSSVSGPKIRDNLVKVVQDNAIVKYEYFDPLALGDFAVDGSKINTTAPTQKEIDEKKLQGVLKQLQEAVLDLGDKDRIIGELKEKLENAFPESIRWQTRAKYGFPKRDMLVDFEIWCRGRSIDTDLDKASAEYRVDNYLGKKEDVK